ncbi:MAG: carbohydrate ABC transporter permease [Bifidobacteriales bacterium]|uniref:Carbohydrate ABC transporter permease n=1 Tax=Bifidobacterium asteroides TaxID=1684 RepID=A0A0F4M738_9BIFI|nr:MULTISPECIES: carbohydrate ABC transporter permease [Bifidobacterium]KJY65586.1 Carbohydrate ABC transporter membrane protein [Bifidobacterium asteroides]MCT6878739.1 carbohydrate ABC transporter permease [Bifidobacteriales bacterium]MBI0087111.1 carbohydrate ABC transporter permease [Bifidobacterium sp. M0404]MBI0146284.1 carbohydrate ABC transporter permease [Bifidobacterium polysaccharolyticum]MBI0152957.1 carbohydrate ABC transporter permease [Bifidobacterium sp. M0399]
MSRKLTRHEKALIRTRNKLSSPWSSAISIIIAVLWTIPTVGLLVTSFRDNRMAISTSGWWTSLSPSHWKDFGLGNYKSVLGGGYNLGAYFVNSFVITIPGVLIPITLALLAAYAFAWCEFPGKNILFVAVFALQVVPIQVTMIPLLSQYVKWGLNNTFWVLWLSHTMFGLPLAIFLLHNFMLDIPKELIEAAKVDGASHVQIFLKVVLPLMVPAIASFAIFQFLWVWNDLLVALAFAGNTPATAPLTSRLSDMVGSRGSAWYLLAPGAFIAMVVPVAVFLFLQRYFVRGMLAGAVKG